MNSINIPFTVEYFNELSGWAFWGVCIALILWLWSVVVIAREKTEDPYDRIVWLLIVLFLNFPGTLLYFLFAEIEKPKKDPISSEKDIKRRANEGKL